MNLVETVAGVKIIGGKRIPQLANPTRGELAAVFNTTEQLRGLLLASDDLYVMDANYADHNQVANDLGIQFDPQTLRVILSKDSINVQFWNKNDDPDTTPETVLQLVNRSARLKRLYPLGTPVEIVIYNGDYVEEASGDFALGA